MGWAEEKWQGGRGRQHSLHLLTCSIPMIAFQNSLQLVGPTLLPHLQTPLPPSRPLLAVLPLRHPCAAQFTDCFIFYTLCRFLSKLLFRVFLFTREREREREEERDREKELQRIGEIERERERQEERESKRVAAGGAAEAPLCPVWQPHPTSASAAASTSTSTSGQV